MLIEPGHVYGFTFSEAPVDDPTAPADGNYRCLQHLTYSELRDAGITTYPETTYLDIDFLKLQDPDTEEVVYVPESYISAIPTVNVVRYPKLTLTVDLDVVSNPNALADLPATVIAAIQDAHEEFDGLDTSDCQLMEYASSWLSTDELAAQGTITTPREPNIYAENIRLRNVVAAMRAELAGLRELVATIP